MTSEDAGTPIALGDRSLPDAFAEIEAAIDRAAAGESLDLTTSDDLVVKYVVPTAAVRGVRSAFKKDADLGWRVTLRPRGSGQRAEPESRAKE